ncbi:MAG TPA: amino acid adenylation domain-containing protein, partial [Symbiobacteriaceae bacterium]|nr:amino acid adenylation domain-containing protein [Symbiobacteriaceae bacterium]
DRGSLSTAEGGAGVIEAELPEELTAQLQALAQQNRLTMSTLLQGAWALLLSRYSGEPEVVFGSTVFGRPADLPGVNAIVGLFANTLPLRLTVPPDVRLLPWLSQIQEQQTDLHRFAHSSLQQVQSWSDMTGDQPLFKGMTAFEHRSMDDSSRGAEWIEAVSSHERMLYPITVVAASGRGLAIRIIYQMERFSTATVERMLGHLQTLLVAMAANPDQPVGALPLLTEAEREQVLGAWSRTEALPSEALCIHDLFEAQVAQQPEVVAVQFADGLLTYAQLNERANRLARHLREQGVGPDLTVGLFVERSPEMIVGLLAVLKAGGAYVPLDPTYPAERLTYMLEDSGATMVLTQERLQSQLEGLGFTGAVFCLDAEWGAVAGNEAANLGPVARPEHLAYTMYTSGSTGKPKGVQVEHRNLVAFALGGGAEHGIHPGERVLQFSTINFDTAVEEIFCSLTHGATLVLRTETVLSAVDVFLAQVAEWGITVLDLPTAYWHELTLQIAEHGYTLPASVRRVIIGGEAVLPERAALWLKHVGTGVELANTYGPTEATVIATACRILPGPDGVWVPSIGRPLPGYEVYLLDAETYAPVPVGVPGELFIGGPGVARGYRNRPEQTAERFLDTPFGRLYRTGDLARWLPNGEISFMGRTDDQVKIRGFRVELGEVESVMGRHEAVRDAVVVARQDGSGATKRLVAYVVPAGVAMPSANELRDFLKERLPEYMIPSVFVTLEALPLLPNGKVNRRALPAPDLSRLDEGKAYVAPRTPSEELVASVWAQVLDLPRVSIHDSFFELGGHSLLATQILSRLRKILKIDLTVRDVLNAPTVAAFAEQVEKARHTARIADVPPLAPVPRNGSLLPLSYAQQRLWFLEQLEPGRPIYHLVDAIQVEGALDHHRLTASLNGVVARHEALRTTFGTVDGQPVQRIAPELTVSLPVVDLSGFSPVERPAELARLTTLEARKPFDLQCGPLLRGTLLRLDETEHVLMLVMHHIVSDGWSTGVLLQELAALYEGRAIPELTVQYPDVALWQRRWLQGEVLSQQLGYWKQQLAGIPPLLELPTDRPRPRVNRFEGAMERIMFPRQLLDGLQALSRSRQVTLFMTLLAAFQVVLQRYSRQEEICVGTPVANRNEEALEGLIGFFVNTLVIRTIFAGNPTFGALLQRVKESTLGAYSHQDVPFEQVVEALQPERSLSHTPLFQVMFVLQNAPMPSAAGLSLSRVTVDRGTSQYDLTLSMEETAEGLFGELEYNTALFDRATVVRLMEHYQNLLRAVVANPETPVANLPLLGESERNQVVADWHPAAAAVDERRVHERFEAQAAAAPDAVAVVCGSERMTYRELNERANQLAQRLRAWGVGRNRLVGICAERTTAMVVALLGVLKAGGAYVPLDPNYPRERLAFMLADSQAPLLLTQTHLLERLPEHGAQVICLDGDQERIAQESAASPVPEGGAADPAYVIYTSGSTGQPKGVLLHHRGLSNVVAESVQLFGLGPASRVLQVISFSFDPSVLDVFMALTSGA